MEKINRWFVNTLRHVVLIYGGSVLWGFVVAFFDPDFYATLMYLPSTVPYEPSGWKQLHVLGMFIPSFLTCCHDRGWRMKSPFYRISDETDLLKRVERLEQRSNCLQ